MNLEKSQKKSITIQDSNKLSMYEGELTKDGMAQALALVKKAYPDYPKGQLSILRELFVEHKFSDQRAIDAVKYVVSNHIYNSLPQIAQFIQYDKEYLTYNQALEVGLEYCEIADPKRKLWRRK